MERLTMSKWKKILMLGAAAPLMMGSAALAVDAHKSGKSEKMNWAEKRQETVRASEILRGDFRSGLNPIGQVDHLVMSKDGSRVQYVVVDVTGIAGQPYTGKGFLSYNAVSLEAGAGFYNIDVRQNDDAEIGGPEEIAITADEADYRLASRILDSEVAFPNAGTREIDDVLIKPESGKVIGFLVNRLDNQLFDDEQVFLPVNKVTYQDGRFDASVNFSDLSAAS